MRYLLAFDIRCPKRAYQIVKSINAFGQRWHASVFLCHLTEKQKRILIRELKHYYYDKEDSIILYPLCEKDWRIHRHFGKPPPCIVSNDYFQ